jgi:ABC-type dipeptide/oligopeptide/nickel transport system permease subunit
MISDGCNLIRTNFGVLLWPGVILFLIVLDFNILGEYVSQRLRNKNTRRGVDAGPV